MNRLFSFCLLATLGLGLTTACDYDNGPGKEPQFSQDFTNGPEATAADTDLDSVSQSQNAYTPIGKGSAADQKTSTNSAVEAAAGTSPTGSMPQTNDEAKSTTREN
ncbi:hypothetical protein [Hymenobacter actinosclerus]|uniref:Uncharacterized protein n=1 Tax=Hymenobacter actinosclerus TaxID=82805 RepID=A0A1I0B367_9BACT|nr:hypothetical protein [Hymenobacter actinosclerus]SET01296.1 hypothetical protein SAMN04487998_0930 [Hymenobacter actinosclerus]